MAERVTIKELVVKLLFEGSESGITKFNQALEAFKTVAEVADAGLRALSDTVRSVTLDIADQADALDEVAGQVGVTAQTYDALAASVQLNGATVGQLDAGLRTLNNSMEEFVRTGKGAGADAFRALLGPDARKRLSEVETVDQALSMVADGLSSVQDPIRQLALAQDVLGRSGTKLLPTLRGGAAGLREQLEAMRGIGTFSPELIETSSRLSDGLAGLSLRARGIRILFGEEAVPALADLVDELTSGTDALRGMLDPELRAGARLLADGFRQLRDWVRVLRTEIAQSERAMGALKSGMVFISVVAGILVLQALPTLVLWLNRTALSAVRAGAQMLLAWAKAAIPILLLAALISAIILLVEDLYVAVTGGDSAIKRMTDSMIEAGGAAEVFGRSVQWLFMGGLGNDLYDLFEWLGSWWDEFSTAFMLLPGEVADLFVEKFEALRSFFAELFAPPEWLKGVGSLFAPPSASVGSGRTSNVNVGGSSVSVAVNGAGDPRAVGVEVARQVDAAVSRHATRVARDLGPAMQY